MPELRFKIPQEGVTLERVQVAKTALEIKGMKLKKSEVYEFIGFAQPAEGDEVFESAADEPKDGFSALFGKGKSGNDTDPDDDPPYPKKKVPAKPEDAAEPVSAAKSPAPTAPAQEWLAPIKEKFLETRRAGASMDDLKKMLLTMHPNTKALAKAFANNILAGFAGEGEEVDAANPYGCNDHQHKCPQKGTTKENRQKNVNSTPKICGIDATQGEKEKALKDGIAWVLKNRKSLYGVCYVKSIDENGNETFLPLDLHLDDILHANEHEDLSEELWKTIARGKWVIRDTETDEVYRIGRNKVVLRDYTKNKTKRKKIVTHYKDKRDDVVKKGKSLQQD